MRLESVEIYSDQTNAAIMRHPGRNFPGLLIQGDSLYSLCQDADALCAEVGATSAGYEVANNMRNALWTYLSHYKKTLLEHDMPLPFSEAPP